MPHRSARAPPAPGRFVHIQSVDTTTFRRTELRRRGPGARPGVAMRRSPPRRAPPPPPLTSPPTPQPQPPTPIPLPPRNPAAATAATVATAQQSPPPLTPTPSTPFYPRTCRAPSRANAVLCSIFAVQGACSPYCHGEAARTLMCSPPACFRTLVGTLAAIATAVRRQWGSGSGGRERGLALLRLRCASCELQGRSGSGWCEAAVRREAQKVASCVGLFFVFRACMGSKAHVYVFLVRL